MDGKKALFERTGFEEIAGLRSAETGAATWHRRSLKPPWAPMISVIIPAHNEEDYIGLTLDAVNRQNYPHFEVIVVANGCSDRTAAIAINHCHRLVVLSCKGLGVARNLGARLARGELLMFLDADTLLEPGALEIAAHKFKRWHAAGTVKGRPDGERLAFRLIYLVKNFLHHSRLHHGSAGVILCWKRQFLHVRGFDEALQVRENSDLIRRLRRFGSYEYLGETCVTTSMRRYQSAGVKHMVWFWFKIWVQSHFIDLRRRDYATVR